MKASIITIGDELLNGEKIDTNSVWISQQLNEIGIRVNSRIAVGDIYQDIWTTLEQEEKKSQFIFITGGLGPTADDITKPLLCNYFNAQIKLDETSLEIIKNIFKKTGKPLLEINIKQAYVPDICKVILNEWGTAPGMWFEKNGVIFVSMPGVPFEMKALMTNKVLPLIKETFPLSKIIHRYILTYGIGESFLAEKIKAVENSLPEHIKLAYLPSYGFVKLRLTAHYTLQQNEQKIKDDITLYHQQLSQLLKAHLIGNTFNNLLDYIIQLCLQKNITIATAESCTSGYIAHCLTEKDGSSAYFLGSIIAYNESVKRDLLEVPEEILQQYTAVSEPVVVAMLKGLLKKIPANYGIAISGYLSSVEENPSFPVGKIFIAVGSLKKHQIHEINLRYNKRMLNRETATMQALNFLKIFIEQND